jgi:hypothetical protein
LIALLLAILPLVSLLLPSGIGHAQSSGGAFTVEKSTIDAGGRFSSGGSFEVTGTIAQPEARTEPASGRAFQAHGGYWPRRQPDYLFNDGFEE